MEAIARYIFTLICGAVLCGIVLAICGGGPGAGMRKTLCGLFLAFLVISPLKKLDARELYRDIGVFSDDAEAAVRAGEEQARAAETSIITDSCEAYILDKAAELGAQIAVSVRLDPDTRMPCAVTVTGNVTPYEKQTLSSYIAQTLGIEKEAQDWKT